jgi:hypothetical protein
MSDHSGQQTVISLSCGGKDRDRLTVNKRRSHRFHMERFNFKKINKAEGEEKYLV